jgi:hypothetical protein
MTQPAYNNLCWTQVESDESRRHLYFHWSVNFYFDLGEALFAAPSFSNLHLKIIISLLSYAQPQTLTRTSEISRILNFVTEISIIQGNLYSPWLSILLCIAVWTRVEHRLKVTLRRAPGFSTETIILVPICTKDFHSSNNEATKTFIGWSFFCAVPDCILCSWCLFESGVKDRILPILLLRFSCRFSCSDMDHTMHLLWHFRWYVFPTSSKSIYRRYEVRGCFRNRENREIAALLQ